VPGPKRLSKLCGSIPSFGYAQWRAWRLGAPGRRRRGTVLECPGQQVFQEGWHIAAATALVVAPECRGGWRQVEVAFGGQELEEAFRQTGQRDAVGAAGARVQPFAPAQEGREGRKWGRRPACQTTLLISARRDAFPVLLQSAAGSRGSWRCCPPSPSNARTGAASAWWRSLSAGSAVSRTAGAGYTPSATRHRAGRSACRATA